MRQISGGSWRLQRSLTGYRSIGAVVAFLLFFPQSCAGATDANGSATTPVPLVKPDQYNVNECEAYFNKLKPGLASGTPDDQAKYTVNRLCEARTADLSRFAEDEERKAKNGGPPVDAISVKTLKAEFVKAIVESNEFDAPGYDRISISGAIIKGDLSLAKITINNALVLKDVQFLGNVDFSYSSTMHNLDISGKLPDSTTLCLKGLQTTASIFINKIDSQPLDLATAVQSFDPPSFIASGGGAPVQNSTFCTDTTGSPSIGLQGARIGGQLTIRDTTTKTIDAEGAQITGQVLIQNSTISDAIDFSAATAGGFFFLQVKSPSELSEDEEKPCERSTVYLDVTNVQGSAEFVRSDLCGISMTGAHITKNVDLLGSKLAFFDFSGSNAEGDLQIGPSRGPPPRLPVWLGPIRNSKINLVLNHSSVALVRVALNNWPKLCDIDIRPEDRTDKCARRGIFKVDFCSRIHPLRSDLPDREFISTSKIEPTTTVADFRFKAFGKPFFCASDLDASPNGYNRSDYILDDVDIKENKVELWLSSTQYAPAEYQLISDFLVTNGQSADAKKIGYAGKTIDTRRDFETGAWLAFFIDLLSRGFIGYGYYPYRAIPWAVFFCVIGAWVFSSANKKLIRVNEGTIKPEDRLGWRKHVFGPFRFRVMKYTKSVRDTDQPEQDYGVVNPFGYSFDALLPIIRLRELHYQIELRGWRHYYFYLQRIVGWVLGIFVLAAFSGLTK
jgi:hypothetical protein